MIATFNDPVTLFMWRYMNLTLLFNSAIAPAKIGNVVDHIVFIERHRTGDDIDVVTHGHLRHFALEAIGVAR